MRPITIIDRGRGPELSGTRITVFDIIPYLKAGHSPTYIAAVLLLSTREVLALMQYLDEHHDEVMAMNARIEERIARGNPPEVEARLLASHAKLLAVRERLAQVLPREEANGASPPE